MNNTEDRFEQLKRKFSPVLDLLSQTNASVQNLSIQDDKLLIRAAVANEAARGRILSEIERIDSSYGDVYPDIRVEHGAEAPNTGQTKVQSDLEFGGRR
jgi:hypothetical protein